jgi:magnesium-transporting ATPase (P-type)
MTKTNFWKQPSAELFAELASSNDGLTSSEAMSRLLRYGSNDATAPKRAPAWLRFTRRSPGLAAAHEYPRREN